MPAGAKVKRSCATLLTVHLKNPVLTVEAVDTLLIDTFDLTESVGRAIMSPPTQKE